MITIAKIIIIIIKIERIAILICKLTSIYKQNELNQYLVVKNKKNEFYLLRNKFYKETS